MRLLSPLMSTRWNSRSVPMTCAMQASRSGWLPESTPRSARAGQGIQVLFRHYAKFLAEARNHANSLIEESMRRWEEATDSSESALAGSWPGNAPEQLVRAGIPVGGIVTEAVFRLAA